MFEGGTGIIYKIMEWITKLAYANLLWLFFSLAGLVLFGIFPATAALFTICRKWLREEEVPVFKTFWRVYKQEFLKSNLLGLLVLLTGIILYVDYLFFQQSDGSLSSFLLFPLLTLGIICLLTALFLFPAFVHYDAGIFQTIKNACFLALFNPMISFLMLINIILLGLIILMVPVVVPFFGISIPAWTTMYLANVTFNKMEQNKKVMNNHI